MVESKLITPWGMRRHRLVGQLEGEAAGGALAGSKVEKTVVRDFSPRWNVARCHKALS